MKQYFQITAIYSSSNSLSIDYLNDEGENNKTINREVFNVWALRCGRFCVGFWEQAQELIFPHLEAYLFEKHRKEILPDYSNVLDIENELN